MQIQKTEIERRQNSSCGNVSTNLQLLGITAIPRLAEGFGIRIEFPEGRALFGATPESFDRVVEHSWKILDTFFKEFNVSWWDVYLNSDIGMERLALAREMLLRNDDVVVDVGCGRGYFSIAATKLSKMVVGLDLMDGVGRHGWWTNFRISMHELDLCDRLVGVKADALNIPFKESSFTVAAAVHSIRNFQDKNSIERALEEMKRVVAKGGSVMVVESLPTARTKAQEAHLQMFQCKVKYGSGELNYLEEEELLQMFQKVGFREIESKKLNYDLSAAPPLFCLDYYVSSLNEREKDEARKAYEEAVNAIREWGEASPPALLVKATK
jgi:ubiquinone/menaquinone biosynthesis C-methylase UbiE